MPKTKAKTKTLIPSSRATELSRSPGSKGLEVERLIPVLLFCLALAFRVWGLSFGLPYFFSADEINKRDAALHLAETHFIHRNSQPSFLYNSLYVVFSIARLLNPGESLVQYHYLGRLLMALLGALTVVVLYRMGCVWDRRLGLLAALLLAILPLHAATSRYIKEDTPLTLMATITTLLVVLYLRHPSRLSLSAAALFAGISFSTKYAGLPLVFPLLLAVAVSSWRAGKGARQVVPDVVLTVLAFWVGFFLVSPIYLLHPDQFLSGFTGQWEYSARGHHDGIIIDPWTEWWSYYIRTGLIPGMTWPVFLLSVAGLVLLVRSREGWVVTVTAVWLYLVFEHGWAKPYPFSARYLLPLAPLLCLSAADALVKGAAFLKQRLPSLPSAVMYTLFGALFFLPPLIKTVLTADEALHDTRLVAGAWMEQAIPPGSNIVMTELPAYLPVSEYWGREWKVFPADRIPELVSAWREGVPLYFVLSSFTYQRYLDNPKAVPNQTRFYRRIMDEFELVKEFRPRWFTYGFHSPVIRIYLPPNPAGGPSSGPRPVPGREP